MSCLSRTGRFVAVVQTAGIGPSNAVARVVSRAFAAFEGRDFCGRTKLLLAPGGVLRRREPDPSCEVAAPPESARRWLARKPRMLVIVALANKMARTVWALQATGEIYRAPLAAA